MSLECVVSFAQSKFTKRPSWYHWRPPLRWVPARVPERRPYRRDHPRIRVNCLNQEGPYTEHVLQR